MMRGIFISTCALALVSSQALAETLSGEEALGANPCAYSVVQNLPNTGRPELKLHIDMSGPDCDTSDMIIMITGRPTNDGPEILYAFRENAGSLVSGDFWDVPIEKRLSDFAKTAVKLRSASDANLDSYLQDDVIWFGEFDKEAIARAIAENSLTFSHSTGCNSDVTYALLDGKFVKLASTTAP